ncbi:DUF6020 family protein [Niastella populi]|nr:DUF6020 family protein [Niastella populi]
MVWIAAPRSVNPFTSSPYVGYVKVTALGEKNDSARAPEVWITSINNSETQQSLNAISLAKGWEKNYNYILSARDQPATQEIKIRNSGKYEIEFISHSWSGKVKIEDGSNTTIVDLFREGPAGSYTYTGSSTFPIVKKFNEAYATPISIISFLALFACSFVCLAFAQLKSNYALLLFPLSLFAFILTDHFFLDTTGKLLVLTFSIGGYILIRKIAYKDYLNNLTTWEKVFFPLVVIYGSFAFVGHQLFLAVYPVKQLIHKISYFILFSAWLTLMSIAFLHATEIIRKKIGQKESVVQARSINPVKLFFTFMGIMVACWLVYFIAFFPAVMSADSLDQWAQATHFIPLNNWHPVFHTLFNKLFITIYKSPASIALAQIVFMATVLSAFLLMLAKKGLPVKWLKWIALGIALIPANGVMAVTLWKDIPFAISLVWLTCVLAKIVTDENYLNKKTSWLEITCALVAAGLFRHNGIPVYILAVIGLMVLYFKTKNKRILVSLSISIAVMAGYFLYISSPERVIPNPPSIKLVAPIHGIAAVKFYNGKLANETVQEMSKILPDSIWRSHYRPFSADEYLFFTNRPFVKNLAEMSTGKVLQLYLNTLAKNPYLVVRDRLNGTEIVWNVFEANGSFNYRYHHDLDENKFGLSANPNFLKKIIEKYLEYSASIADPVLWRAGVYNFLILLLMLPMAKRSKRFLLFFIPVIGTNISLLLSMTLQNFRYVYYVPMIFGIIWLLSISNIMAEKKFKHDKK